MGTGFVNKTETAVIGTRSYMTPLENQAGLLNSEILNTAYAIGWLGQSYPPFMTAEYATLPFYIDNDPGASQQQLNWTAETTKLWTELECWPAQVYKRNISLVERVLKSGVLTTIKYFDNGQGCTAMVGFDPTPNSVMFYLGYKTNPLQSGNLEGPNCPATSNSTHQFLAIWEKTTPSSNSSIGSPTANNVNITALFCQPSYYKQQVLVTVVTDGYQPQNTSIQPISSKETLSEKEFDSTAFEYLLSTGTRSQDVINITQDFPFQRGILLGNRLVSIGITGTVSNMVGFALAGSNEQATIYSDPNVMHAAFSRAHKYLFSVAVSHLLVNETNVGNSTAVSSFQQSGIIVSRLFSAIVEGLLLLVAIFTISLLWTCHKSTSYLNANPASISRLVSIFRNGSETNELFRPVDHADEKSLQELFQGDKFRLARSDSSNAKSVYIEKVDDSEQEQSDKRLDKPAGYYEPIRPTALRREMGLLFGAFQIGALVGISYLKVQNDRNNGAFYFLLSCHIPSTCFISNCNNRPYSTIFQF
jgi:hypothetical protein